MHMGSMKFKQRGREEQAEADGTEASLLLFYCCFYSIKLQKWIAELSNKVTFIMLPIFCYEIFLNF